MRDDRAKVEFGEYGRVTVTADAEVVNAFVQRMEDAVAAVQKDETTFETLIAIGQFSTSAIGDILSTAPDKKIARVLARALARNYRDAFDKLDRRLQS